MFYSVQDMGDDEMTFTVVNDMGVDLDTSLAVTATTSQLVATSSSDAGQVGQVGQAEEVMLQQQVSTSCLKKKTCLKQKCTSKKVKCLLPVVYL